MRDYIIRRVLLMIPTLFLVTVVVFLTVRLIPGDAMELIFSLPGMGRLFLDAINRRDYPFVSGINVMLASIGLVLILLTDLSYAYLDPRVRYK